MKDFDATIGSAEDFMKHLTSELNSLDSKNILTMVQSEQKIKELMNYVEYSLKEVDKVEKQLEEYDTALSSIETQMSQMKNQESFINISHDNTEALSVELAKLVGAMNISQVDIGALSEADLTADSGVRSCISACEKLTKLNEFDVPIAFKNMNGVQQQLRYFDELKGLFSHRLVHHLQTECERERKPGLVTDQGF